jgi:hypothetical protein
MVLKKFNIKRSLIVSLSASLICCTFASTSFAENNLDSGNQNTFYNDSLNAQNLEDLSVDQLIEIRDKAIDENLEPLREFGEDSIQRRKDSILNFEFGLVAYIDKAYNNLTEKEKLIKQIELVDYQNYISDIMDPSGDYFKNANEMYQISQYLQEKGKNPKYYESQDSLKFLIDNLQELCDFVDYDEKNVVERVDPSIKLFISEEEKVFLNNDLEKVYLKDSLSDEVKSALKELQNNENYYDEVDAPSLRTDSASYRQNALAYARKHGYTNGYYGSTDRHNNAPSPYYNFQKDGNGDCANFVSQCLRTGGVTFWENGNDDTNKWFYYSTNKRSPSWSGAYDFNRHWSKRVASQTLTVNNTLNFLQPATPIGIYDKDGKVGHILITTDKHSNGYNFSYAAHSDEGKRTNLLEKLKGKKIAYYKIYW